MGGKTRPPYPAEFRAEAVRLARTSGSSVSEIAKELGCSAESLRLWMKQADLDEGIRQDGLTTEQQDENRKLRRQLRIVTEERDILKKAVGYFAKEADPNR